jgi:acyl-coenzyme A synthetase/AMP-(fatty) acid ligase
VCIVDFLFFEANTKGLAVLCRGYLGNEKATQESITPDGWFKTGDIAIRDKEGLYYIVDRMKELIKYKGCVMRLNADLSVRR